MIFMAMWSGLRKWRVREWRWRWLSMRVQIVWEIMTSRQRQTHSNHFSTQVITCEHFFNKMPQFAHDQLFIMMFVINLRCFTIFYQNVRLFILIQKDSICVSLTMLIHFKTIIVASVITAPPNLGYRHIIYVLLFSMTPKTPTLVLPHPLASPTKIRVSKAENYRVEAHTDSI